MTGIVYMGNLKYCPFLDKYLIVLCQLKQEFEIIYWNRDCLVEPLPHCTIHVFKRKSELSKSKLMKIFDFYSFSRFAVAKIIERGYDRLIILTTLTGIFLFNLLMSKYKGKYIFDIRDYSYEDIVLYKWLEDRLIKHSAFTCISSKGFLDFLPSKYQYVMAHNFLYSDLEVNRERKMRRNKAAGPIRIVFLGAIRYFEHFAGIIRRFENDSRFILVFHGNGEDYLKLRDFCNSQGFQNVQLTGEYNNTDKPNILAEADIINYHYKIDKSTKRATANKFYDGIIYKIPQLTNEGDLAGLRVCEGGVGISIGLEDTDMADKVYDYFRKLDYKTFDDNCNKILNNVLEEDRIYVERIKDFLM